MNNNNINNLHKVKSNLSLNKGNSEINKTNLFTNNINNFNRQKNTCNLNKKLFNSHSLNKITNLSSKSSSIQKNFPNSQQTSSFDSTE